MATATDVTEVEGLSITIDDIAMWEKPICAVPFEQLKLLTAALQNDVNKVKMLLKTGISPDLINHTGEIGKWSLIQFLVRVGSHETAFRLLRRSKHVHDLDVKGRNLLHLAALSESATTVGIILRFKEYAGGFELDAQDDDGNTALHYARERGISDMVIMLIVHGANPFVINDAGLTPKEARKKLIDNDTEFD
jgi:ankyrin repeat protein